MFAKGKSGREFYEICRVCGDGHARMHYGVLTCFGCKGFFRRTLKRTSEYSCRHQGNCIVDKHERNSCRFCRFKRCLEVGMDPKAVRPDRDATGRHYQTKVRRLKFTSGDESSDEAIITEDWSRKLSVEMRTILMQLMNIEIMVNRGDTNQKAVDLYPLPFNSIQQILNNPSLLNGKRTEVVRYEPYRQVENNELVAVAHRRLIVTIDWVNHLFDMMDLTGFEDKIALIRNGFAPLMIFSFAAATAKTTKEKDIICLCSSGYVPRNVHSIFNKPYHLANRIIERTIDELTQPFRNLNFTEEEIVLMKAIIILNPHVKGLSSDATDQVADLRDRIQEVLYHVVRETHPKEVASSRFGNLLLFLPTIMILGNIMCENIQLMQSFERKDADQMLLDLFETEAVPTHEIRKPIDPCCSSESIEFRTSMAYNYGYIEPSSSSSSISSIEFLPQLSSFDQRRYMDSTNSLHDMLSECITESDPDYNTTLTPDTFNEMQQAHTGINVIDIDYHGTPPNSPEFSLVQFSRPEFYIGQ
ncbi:unnamed protein product [Dracunculus medinensis]|uniref:Nuclear receptor domain-containing protein n=1 Tax=Dracunculus medinensis TaxID=318479 RepID=A0A0N4UIJ1_DRAME|nr:unnamed protein product [Dracunculus medinensis]